MTPFIRRIAGSSIRHIEALLQPGVQGHAALNRHFLLPQFQTALGTAVHAAPVVDALARAVPDGRIIIAGNRFAEQIYRGNPHVERILPMPSPVQDFAGAVTAIRSQPLFEAQPFTVLLTSGNERSKVTLWSAFAGQSRRVGFAVIPELLHQPVAWDAADSQIGNNLRILREIGVDATHTEPRIYLTAAQGIAAERQLVALGAEPARRRIAMVTQTSPTQYKKWRTDRWVSLANTLVEALKADIIFVGTAAESKGIDDLRQRIAYPTVSVAGQTSISELAAIFARCDFGITLDTGPLHVGRAAGLPMVIIAPAWSPVHEWLPVGDSRYKILKNADFQPPAPEDYIIDEVSLDDVLQAAYELDTLPEAQRDVRAASSLQRSEI